QLAAQSAGGELDIRGEWPAEAGICDQPPMLQVVAQVKGAGTIVLLSLPAGNRVTSYPVKLRLPGQQGIPEAPASQVGVQMFRPQGPVAYQGAEGSVDIYGYAKTVSGRFAVTL